MLMPETIGKFIRYIISGSLAVLVHLSILVFLVEIVHMDKMFATSSGFVIACVVNYLIQYHWVFSSGEHHSRSAFFYFGFALVMIFVNAKIFDFFLSAMGFYYLICQILATGIVFLLNFICNLTITFRSSRNRS